MKSSLGYLTRFVLVTSLLFTVWSVLGTSYLQALLPAVNCVAVVADWPFSMEWHEGHLLYWFQPTDGTGFRLEAVDHGAVYLNLVPVLALLLATPGRDVVWHLRWLATACVLLWTTHVLSFVLGGPVALWQFSATGPAAAALVAPLSTSIQQGQAVWLLDVLEVWGIWGQYGLCLGLWWFASLRPQTPLSPARTSAFSELGRWRLRSTTS